MGREPYPNKGLGDKIYYLSQERAALLGTPRARKKVSA